MYRSTAPRSIANSTVRDIFCPASATLVTGCSVRNDLLAEPLSGIELLLISCINDPLLILRIDDFTGYRIKPVTGHSCIADSPPEFADEISQDCSLLSR